MRQYAVVALAVFTLWQSAYGADLQVKALGAQASIIRPGSLAGRKAELGPPGQGERSSSERDMISRPAQVATR